MSISETKTMRLGYNENAPVHIETHTHSTGSFQHTSLMYYIVGLHVIDLSLSRFSFTISSLICLNLSAFLTVIKPSPFPNSSIPRTALANSSHLINHPAARHISSSASVETSTLYHPGLLASLQPQSQPQILYGPFCRVVAVTIYRLFACIFQSPSIYPLSIQNLPTQPSLLPTSPPAPSATQVPYTKRTAPRALSTPPRPHVPSSASPPLFPAVQSASAPPVR